ncbi:hypothetical protein L317_05454 [Escherichia coli SHECO003]|nr:hypothetical protein L317_05454 [Escherichia coli SHECO003]
MNQKFEAVNAIDRNVTDVADANDSFFFMIVIYQLVFVGVRHGVGI